MPVPILENQGGAALDTIQVINSAVSATVSIWGSTIPCTFTTSGQTLTLPTIATSDIGKEITVQNAGITSFALAIATGVITSAIGIEILPASTFVIKAVDTNTAVVTSTNAAQGVLAAFGSAVLDNQTFTTNTFVNSTNGIFAIPSAGTWRLRYDISTEGTGANTNSHVRVVDSLGVLQLGTERSRGAAVTTNQVLTGEVIVTTVGETTYTLQGRNGGSGTMSVVNTGNGNSTISWEKLSGFASLSSVVSALQGALQIIDRTSDLGDWILLNGRLKSTLTPSQQAVATALGYGTNIPDMRGRLPIGAGGTAAVAYQGLGGTNNILQNQLPNVTLGGSTSDPGGHTHTVTSWTGSKVNVSGGSGLGVLDVLGQTSPPSQTSSSAGGHTHTITTSSINGGVTQQNHLPPVRGSNWFVWLGPTSSSVSTPWLLPGVQTDTTLGNVTIAANINTLVVDPPSIATNKQIVLPGQLDIADGQSLSIYFGGAVQAFNAVVSTLSIVPPAGMTLTGALTPVEALSGDSLTYIKFGSAWRRIDT